MRIRQFIAILLAMGVLFSSAVPVLAVGDMEDIAMVPQPLDSGKETIPLPTTAVSAPAFSAKLIFDGDGYGVLGTVDFLPADTESILPMVSVDNAEYEELPEFSWAADGAASQICLRDGESFERYLCGLEDALWLKLRVTLADDTQYETAPAKVIRESVPAPDEPPAFQAELKKNSEGYVVMGRFAGFTPDTREIYTLYSLDGKSYQPVVDRGGEPLGWHLGHSMNGGFSSLGYQSCVLIEMEPLKSYLRGTLEQFYIKLYISTWSGESYESQSALISRGEPQPPPEGSTIQLGYPAGMLAIVRPPIYGKCNVTAREGFAVEDLYELLPNTLPLVIKLADTRGAELDRTQTDFPAVWRLHDEKLSAVSDGQYIIEDAVEPPVIPAGQAFSMATGIYLTVQPPTFSSWESPEVRLIVNTIPEDSKANIALSGDIPGGKSEAPMRLAFHEKPSGAAAIRYFYYYDSMSDWVQAGDLMEQGMVDSLPGSKGSIRYDLFAPDEAPYLSYLSGQLDGFLVGVEIEGGVFDGERHVLRWPDAYEMPPHVPEFEGSGGNENNVGDGDTGSGDSSGNGGQRPGLPDEDSSGSGGQLPDLPDGENPPVTTPSTNGQDSAPSPEPDTQPKPDIESAPITQVPPVLPPDQQAAPVWAVSPQPTPTQPVASVPQSSPQTAEDSKPDAPLISSDPSAAPEASKQPPEEAVRTPGESKKFPTAAAVSVVVVGVSVTAAIVAAASTSGTAASGGMIGKVLSALKRFFFRK